jgi:hypothetical protein
MAEIIYRHRQFSRHVAVSFVAAAALIGVTTAALARGQPVLLTVGFSAFALVALGHYVLSSLTVEVSDRYLMWHFAGGFWRKRVARADIVKVERVRLPWWYGIGVKYTPSAWVYVVAPGNGVKVMLADRSAVCIGTDDADALAAALSAMPPQRC